MLSRFFKDVARTVKRVFNPDDATHGGAGAAAGGGNGRVFFGASLEHASVRGHPFAQLVWFLQTFACEVPGLFRVPGEQDAVDQLVDCYERCEPVDLVQRFAVAANPHNFCHTAASTLKKLIREVPGGLLDGECIEQIRAVEVFQRTGRGPEEDADIENLVLTKWSEYVGILGNLPSANFEALGQLVNFLVHVSKFEEVNHASASNLALCFAPSLADADACADAMEFMAVSAATQSMLDFLVETARPFRLHGHGWAEADSMDCILEWLHLALRDAEGTTPQAIQRALSCRLGVFTLGQLVAADTRPLLSRLTEPVEDESVVLDDATVRALLAALDNTSNQESARHLVIRERQELGFAPPPAAAAADGNEPV